MGRWSSLPTAGSKLPALLSQDRPPLPHSAARRLAGPQVEAVPGELPKGTHCPGQGGNRGVRAPKLPVHMLSETQD